MNGGRSHNGFTIVELLIVIVVIAILAAITVVAFNGVQSRAVDAVIKSGLHNGITALETDKVLSGVYPASLNALNNGQGLSLNADTQASYNVFGSSYCLQMNHTRSDKVFHVKATQQTATEGPCTVTVSTAAGSGARGSANGAASAASFYEPHGVAVAQDGTLFVADARNGRIRKVATDGIVSTFATGLTHPTAIAIDSAGTLYVGEGGGHRVRKVSPTGVVTTLAGSGVAGWADGSGTAAQFNQPNGVAVDGSGNVFVADYINHRIRKITPAGVVTTVAGASSSGTVNGDVSVARFQHPAGISVATDGTLYVADTWNHLIRKITPGGTISTVIGNGAGYAEGNGTAARIRNPHSIAIDGTTLYVVDSGNHRIRKITANGDVMTIAGTGATGFADGTGTTAQFNAPAGMTIDANGTLYVADKGNDRIRKITQ